MGMQPLPTVSLRQPASMKTGDTLDPSPVGGFTKIYHPKFVWAPMFTLPNLEYDGTSKRFGVHHATALWAAQIIACNTLSFLSTEQNAASDPGFPLDAILLAGSYFFYRKDGSSEYGVCESFSCWGFPHQEVPAEWQAMVSGVSLISGSDPAYAMHVQCGDVSCRVSGFEDAADIAHLIPYAQAEEQWFRSNCLSNYNSSNARGPPYSIHDDANLLLLRKDLHTSLFDQKYWAFVPRRGRPAVSYLHYAKESLFLYHGRETHPLHVHPAYLYARFAWAVLPLSRTFVSLYDFHGVPIKIWDASKDEWEEKAVQKNNRGRLHRYT